MILGGRASTGFFLEDLSVYDKFRLLTLILKDVLVCHAGWGVELGVAPTDKRIE